MFGREFAVLSICVFFFRPNVLADKPDCVRNDNGRNISLLAGECDKDKASFILKSIDNELAFTIACSSSVAQGKQFILQFGTCKIEAQIFIGRNQAGFIVLVDKSGQGPYYYLPIEGKMEKTKITFRGAYFGNTKTIFCEPFTKDKRENLVPVVYVAEKTIYNMYVFFDKAEYYELTGWEFTGWKTITVGVTTLLVCALGSVLIPGIVYFVKKSKEKEGAKKPAGKSMNKKKEAIPEISNASKKKPEIKSVNKFEEESSKTAKHVTEFKKRNREEKTETTKSSPYSSTSGKFVSKK